MAAENSEPPASPGPPRRDRKVSPVSRQFALALELPFLVVSAILVGGGFGYLLDRWLGTQPLFLVILGGLGFYAGVRDLLRRLGKNGDGNG